MTRSNVFYHGKVHLMDSQCKTCIFHPGNRMRLKRGRVEEMVAEAKRSETAIVCHSTLDKDQQAVCRGLYSRYSTLSLRLAQVMDRIQEVK